MKLIFKMLSILALILLCACQFGVDFGDYTLFSSDYIGYHQTGVRLAMVNGNGAIELYALTDPAKPVMMRSQLLEKEIQACDINDQYIAILSGFEISLYSWNELLELKKLSSIELEVSDQSQFPGSSFEPRFSTLQIHDNQILFFYYLFHSDVNGRFARINIGADSMLELWGDVNSHSPGFRSTDSLGASSESRLGVHRILFNSEELIEFYTVKNSGIEVDQTITLPSTVKVRSNIVSDASGYYYLAQESGVIELVECLYEGAVTIKSDVSARFTSAELNTVQSAILNKKSDGVFELFVEGQDDQQTPQKKWWTFDINSNLSEYLMNKNEVAVIMGASVVFLGSEILVAERENQLLIINRNNDQVVFSSAQTSEAVNYEAFGDRILLNFQSSFKAYTRLEDLTFKLDFELAYPISNDGLSGDEILYDNFYYDQLTHRLYLCDPHNSLVAYDCSTASPNKLWELDLKAASEFEEAVTCVKVVGSTESCLLFLGEDLSSDFTLRSTLPVALYLLDLATREVYSVGGFSLKNIQAPSIPSNSTLPKSKYTRLPAWLLRSAHGDYLVHGFLSGKVDVSSPGGHVGYDMGAGIQLSSLSFTDPQSAQVEDQLSFEIGKGHSAPSVYYKRSGAKFLFGTGQYRGADAFLDLTDVNQPVFKSRAHLANPNSDVIYGVAGGVTDEVYVLYAEPQRGVIIDILSSYIGYTKAARLRLGDPKANSYLASVSDLVLIDTELYLYSPRYGLKEVSVGGTYKEPDSQVDPAQVVDELINLPF